jgi:hypothetical protein
MKGIEAVLGLAPGIVGAARADADGNVSEIAGQVDGESLCAVAAMSKAPLVKASEILGLGALRDWSFSYAHGALYVHHDDGLVAVQGGATKAPETVMKKLAQALEGRSV